MANERSPLPLALIAVTLPKSLQPLVRNIVESERVWNRLCRIATEGERSAVIAAAQAQCESNIQFVDRYCDLREIGRLSHTEALGK